MRGTKTRPVGPTGGLHASRAAIRPWRWELDAALLSRPIPCKKEEWYLVRASGGAEVSSPFVTLRYFVADELIEQQAVPLLPSPGVAEQSIGWFLTPPNATHFRLHLGDSAVRMNSITIHAVGSRDPVCHPAANVPRWSTYQRSTATERVLIPESLAGLSTPLADLQPVLMKSSGTIAKLAATARGNAVVLDPACVRSEGLNWDQLTRIAADAVVIIDLETAAGLAAKHARSSIRSANYRDRHCLFSARNEYADTATRGFALQDIFPFSVMDEDGAFQMRTIRHLREWKQFADEHAVATLFSCQTPWEGRVKDVLSAGMPTARGELIVTDLPWLVAGQRGALLAPRLAAHALRMHLGGAIEDEVQYWNRWDETHIIVRDIADMTRRYVGLQPVRWASRAGAVVLGLSLTTAQTTRQIVLDTGRIDAREQHDGIAPEPMMIVMRVLERRMREGDAWARRYLANCGLMWRFESASGHKYATMYSAAPADVARSAVVTLRLGDTDASETIGGERYVTMRDDVGILGDGSIEFVSRLLKRIMAEIERAAK